MGNRADMIVKIHDTELLIEEDKPTTDSTRMLEDRGYKIAEEMKDTLWGLFDQVNFEKNKIRSLLSFGISTFKYNAYFDICDYKNGYIARITRSKRFTIPSNLKRIEDILVTLSMILIFKRMIKNNIDILSRSSSTNNLQQVLKRPYDYNNDEFSIATKRNHCAQSPDGKAGRFKSIFTSQK